MSKWTTIATVTLLVWCLSLWCRHSRSKRARPPSPGRYSVPAASNSCRSFSRGRVVIGRGSILCIGTNHRIQYGNYRPPAKEIWDFDSAGGCTTTREVFRIGDSDGYRAGTNTRWYVCAVVYSSIPPPSPRSCVVFLGVNILSRWWI